LWMAHRLGWTRAIVTTLTAIAIALPISFALYAPLGGWATLPRNLYERSLLSTNSLGEWVYLFMRESMGWMRFNAQQVAARASLLGFIGVAVPMLLVAWMRAKNPKGLHDPAGFWLRVLSVVTVAYLAIGSFWFQAWYLVWPVALVSLWPSSKLQRVVAAYCASTMVAAVTSDYLRVGAVLPGSIISSLNVCVILIPVAVTLATSTPLRVWRRHSLSPQPAQPSGE